MPNPLLIGLNMRMIAHGGGIDEMMFVLVPLMVFLTMQWLSRRKASGEPEPGTEAEQRLERRRRLAGGLVPETDDRRPKRDDAPEGPVTP